ncbi:MAG: polymer-forming cytoskeletal protein [Spirochaetota bacterium]
MEENEHKGRYNSSSVSVIGEGAIYRGDIDFDGVLHVNGDFHGNIKGNGDLGIGLTGRVRSVIHAGNVIISGLVWGNIFAGGRVAVKSSAIVIGDIQATTLVVEEGSILHGKLEILDSEEPRKIAKPSLLSYRKAAGKESSEYPEKLTESSESKTEEGEKPRKSRYSVWD